MKSIFKILMTPFAYQSTCYLLDVKYSKAYNAQILDVYQVGDTVLDSIYIKISVPFSCTMFQVTVQRDGSG
jgi:hypothetical protein